MTVGASSTDLASHGARGASYVVLGQIVRTVILFVSTVVLSRLLAPDDFGLMAIALSVVALGELVRDSGLGIAVARDVPLSPGQKSNLFWINLGLGAATSTIVILAAPLIASVFHIPELTPMLQWVGLTLVLSGYSTQFRGELNRQMRFAALAVVDTLPAVIGLVVAIGWAIVDPSPWALITQQITTALVGAIIVTPAARWFPGLPTREPIGEFLRFGAGLLGTQMLAYGARNADNYLLGFFWGPASLGYYSRAYQLLMAPMNQLLAPLTRVAVPVLSRSVGEADAFNRRVLSAQLATGAPLAVAYGLGFGLAAPVVAILLGPEWGPTVAIFQGLCLGGIFRAMNQATYWAFVSSSKTGALLRSYLVTQPLIIACMVAGVPFGAVGVAYGHSLGYAAAWAISIALCGRVTPLKRGATYAQAAMIFGFFVLPAMLTTLVATSLIGGIVWQILAGVLVYGLWLGVTLMIPGPRAMVLSTARLLRMAAKKQTG